MSAALQLLRTPPPLPGTTPGVATAGTPYLDLDVPAAVTRYRRIAACLPGTSVHYAVGANPAPGLLAALAAAGGRFDVAGPAEVVAALRAGAAAGDLVYSNPVKRRQDIAFAARLGVRVFVVDSIEETQKVTAVAPGSMVLCRILTSEDGPEPWLLDLGGSLPARLEGGTGRGRAALTPPTKLAHPRRCNVGGVPVYLGALGIWRRLRPARRQRRRPARPGARWWCAAAPPG